MYCRTTIDAVHQDIIIIHKCQDESMHKHNLTGNLIDNKLPLDLVLSSDENAKVSKELTLDEEALALQFLVLLDGPST